jgi:small subunit ribosomal protein S6
LAQNVYEGLFIFDPARYNRDTEGVSRQVPALIEKLGGEILVSRLWEERRLAYSLKGQRRGTYWLLYFRLDAGQLAEIRRQCAINENILRVLFLKVDPRIVDTLVAHAKTAGTPATAAEGEDRGEPVAAAAAATAESEETKAAANEE